MQVCCVIAMTGTGFTSFTKGLLSLTAKGAACRLNGLTSVTVKLISLSKLIIYYVRYFGALGFNLSLHTL
jgi:hypothetical protein